MRALNTCMQALLLLGKYARAREEARQALAIDPGHVKARYRLALAQVRGTHAHTKHEGIGLDGWRREGHEASWAMSQYRWSLHDEMRA